MMPGSPTQGLIVGQAAFALAVLEGALDPIALALHLGQSKAWRIFRRVRQAVFDRLRRSDLAPDDQTPAPRLGFLAVPDPDPPGRDFDLQHSARAVAQDLACPRVRVEPL